MNKNTKALFEIYSSIKKKLQALKKRIKSLKSEILKAYLILINDHIFINFLNDGYVNINDPKFKHFLDLLKTYKFSLETYSDFGLVFAREKGLINKLNNPIFRLFLLFKNEEKINIALNSFYESEEFVNLSNRLDLVLHSNLTYDESDTLEDYYSIVVELRKKMKKDYNNSVYGQLAKKIRALNYTRERIEEKSSHFSNELKQEVVNKRYELTNLSLKHISITKITNKEKWLNAFRSLGCKNAYSVCMLRPSRLLTVYGIGEKTVDKIARTVEAFYQKEYDKHVVVINKDEPGLVNIKILTVIYKIIEINNYFYQSKQEKDLLIILQRRLENLRKYEDFSLWPFLDIDEREKSQRDFIEIKNEITAIGDKQTKAITAIDMKNIAPQFLWDDFSRRPIEYIKTLERSNKNGGSQVAEYNKDGQYTFNELGFNQQNSSNQYLLEVIAKQKFNLDGMKTSLRPYQIWGLKYILHQKRTILGDEMGLGKTVEAIAAMTALSNKGEKHFVVVCPAAVLINWCREVKKHSSLDVIKIHYDYTSEDFNKWEKEGGVLITTYSTLNKIRHHFKRKISMLTVDEAHYVKHSTTERHKRIKSLTLISNYILFMTGTVLENKVLEMINLIDMLDKNLALELTELLTNGNSITFFYEKVASIYIRRKRKDVASELPDLIENEEWCQLTETDRNDYYKSIINKDFFAARRVSWNHGVINESSKAQRLLELLQIAIEEERKVLIFSFFLDTIDKIKELLKDKCLTPITGKISSIQRQKIIDEFNESKPGTVLCCQINSGGIGLNIQSASMVIICEPQYKPSTENQAISRSYRMGQTRNVLVYRLLNEGTLDELLLEKLKSKQKEFDVYADKSKYAAEVQDISDSEIKSMFDREYEKISKLQIDTKQNSHVVSKDYLSLLNLSYEKLVDVLKRKYGTPKGSYFLTETCKSTNNSIKRTSEGLFIHHIDEDKKIDLSSSQRAVLAPFEYQLPERLVYCDLLEHLILHIKIIEKGNIIQNGEMLGVGGVSLITRQINDCYSGMVFQLPYMNAVRNAIAGAYTQYVKILKYLLRLPDYGNFKSIINYDSLVLKTDSERFEKLYNDIIN